MNIKKYTTALNFRTLISVIISLAATWIAYNYNLAFNLDLTLISIAVVFPLVFTLGSAFQRREKALEHLGRAKGALASIKYCFSVSKAPDVAKEKIATKIMKQSINTKYYENVKNLCNFLLQKDQEIEDNKDKYWADFKRHLLQTDKFRNQNFADTFPDLYVLIEEWL